MSSKPDYISPAPSNAKERRDWDRMSFKMERYHAAFRQTFHEVWDMADQYEKRKYSLRDYLDWAADLKTRLDHHHGIEEELIFPVLALRLPEFQDEHPEQHRQIHEGLARYITYIQAARRNESSYSAEGFRDVMRSFGPVLFHHLDEEVKTLKGSNLRRYYTLEEVRALPM